MRLVLALLALATLAACGPVRSTAALIDAEVQLESARAAGAPSTSLYEYTAAEAHLEKARETWGRSKYEASLRFAARARDLAEEAKKNAIAASNRAPAEGR